MPAVTERSADVLRAFAEPTRLALLVLLAESETCVCDLGEALRLPQPAVSRHLAVLRRAGLVAARREGKWMWYRLAAASSGLRAGLLQCLAACRDEMPGLGAAARRCDRLRGKRSCC